MNKKNWLFVVIGLLLMIGIGGKVFMDNQRDKEEIKVQKAEEGSIEAERMSVVALKNRYADIKSVEFEKSVYDEMTGSYGMFIKMTNQKNESVSFSYSFWKKSGKIGLNVVKDREVQVRGVTTNKVRVIYSNKDEGEV
ncbi:hypothetical protein JSQ81_05390 [Sporosarcina sp. Marseille-Q4063]|uniref:hypothetical protein n=1 Tax=Sporosarcina sp. Marseille-Q4063 TaxID=2810514 RepID=UPI001BB03D5E|nr:hypothetical protein [Sporosarcina sp. Marseille-Q4063]QUW23005.1 hypothetical protein JSQ81_05390 [Sporosarcina sp. Marseille-Q4063]